MSIMKMNRLLAATLLLAVAPVAGAWNLVSKINADARQMPRAPSTVVVASGTASARYQVSAGNPLNIGNGIDSLITVNGVRAGQLITLPAGSSTLIIVSTLTDRGARIGAFSKTVVLIQSFM